MSSHVVYRSLYARDFDQFWYDHPELTLWLVGLLIATAIIFLVSSRR